ncbi:MAG: DNA-directed RNA polymerase subunit H [Candidatus Micrarchaeota archaeon]|nr:DNA-directed RNA polymerase subunit H [Candidatus Micrarchaeota archaeon]
MTSKVQLESFLVPAHKLVPKNKVDVLLETLKLRKDNFPKMKDTDPQAKTLGAEKGDLVEITRKEETGESTYYRLVV